jgi:Kef-type K+ transport system membrane component KefB/nucleotide-binding universal stress UspA family protein
MRRAPFMATRKADIFMTGKARILLFSLCALLLPLGAAWAAQAENGRSDRAEGIFVAQIVLLLVVGRLLGEVMQRVRQPAILGQLLAGIVLGPSIFGALWPQAQHLVFPADPLQKSMIDAVSQLGILMLLLLTGMETDLKLVRKVGHAAITISLAGVAVPFVFGFALGEFLPVSILPHPDKRLVTALFLGTALAISSVKIVATVVREMNFMRRNLGQIIVASAILEDTIGWIIIAIIFGLGMQGHINLASALGSTIGTALFLAASLTVGRKLVFRLIRWANDSFESEFFVITVILVIMGSMSFVTYLIGVHTVLGAFVAGVLIGDSPILTQHIQAQLRGLIAALFMPVFFGVAGLSTDMTILKDPHLLLLALGLVVIASGGKFIGAFIGGSIGGMTRAEALAIGCGMNARGSTEVIIASIGLSIGVLSQNLYTLIVAMAIITTMGMPPMLRWALGRIPMGRAERLRLAREEMDAKGFVSNLERVLLAVDDSVAGRFTSHLAGLITGARGLPTTVLRVNSSVGAARAGESPPTSENAEALKAGAAATSATLGPESESAKPREVDITTRVQNISDDEAISEEAKKGYDVLFIGIAHGRTQDGAIAKSVSRLAEGFDGALALLATDGGPIALPGANLSILVPVNGTEPSRRGAEIALALARPRGSSVTALYVSGKSAAGKNKPAKRARPANAQAARRQEHAVLKEIAQLGERYDVKVASALRSNMAPESAILEEAERGRYDLIVMGVSRRPDRDLFFGNTSLSILKNWDGPILFIAN